MKVLLVEDNRADARLFVELVSELPGRPMVVTTATTLGEAKQRLAEHDVVFLDLSLPDAHGLSTLVDLLAVDRARPVVVLTGNDDDRVAVEAVKAGAQDYLRKAEITPGLIARTARYAVERVAAAANLGRLAVAEAKSERAQFLATVTAAATSSLDRKAMLLEVAHALVPTLGDGCVIDVVGANGQPERLAHATGDPAEEAGLAAAAYRFTPGTVNPNSPTLTVFREGKTLVFPELDVAAISPSAEYTNTVTQLGIHSLLVVPMIARDRVVGAISLVMMRSDRTFDDELRLLAEDVASRVALGFDNANLYEQAQRAIRGRDELMAVVSHDLRNPLGVVGLALQMLQDDPTAVAIALPRAQRAVERMVRLIDDLLDVARIDSGTLSVEPRPVELAPMLDDLFEQHRVLASEKRLELVRDFAALGTVNLDRHRIGQALSNLVGNALKLTPAGGKIQIHAEQAADRVVIAVSDTGPGIAPEHRAHLFDRFWQPERRRDGVGLGLAIVKGIVDAHGGEIEVDSMPGAGATFRILLPTTLKARALVD